MSVGTQPAAGDVAFINADIGGMSVSLGVAGSRITARGESVPGVRQVDLRHDRLLPGLINGHDHLQLNDLPRIPYAAHCRNAREWISQVKDHLRTDSDFAAGAAASRARRLLVGAMKNLLCGVTTVAHHDPLYPSLLDRGFPIRVLAEFGWAHSLYIDGDARVRTSYEQTPRHWPWIIHAAEGVDAEAAAEFERLEALGCVGVNTRIVHGVALTDAQLQRLVSAGAGLIWCPSSNRTLFGATARVAALVGSGRIALGTDSRLTGARDLLEEVRIARDWAGIGEAAVESMVTGDAAQLLHLRDRGHLNVGACADLVVLPAGMPLSQATRADVRLVMVAGQPCYADPHYAAMLQPQSHWAQVCVDGRPKLLSGALASLLQSTGANEPGLELTNMNWRVA